jgi:hypothetical protein
MSGAAWSLYIALVAPAGDAEAAAKALAPFIDEQTLFVARARIDLLPTARFAALAAPMSPEKNLEWAAEMVKGEAFFQAFRAANAKEMFLLANFGDAYLQPPRWTPKPVVPIPPGANAETFWRALRPQSKTKPTVAANAITSAKARSQPVAGMEAVLAEAFAAAGDAPLVGLLIVTPDHRRVFSETFKPLAGLRWASIAIEGPHPVKATLRVDFDTEANSKALWEAWPDVMSSNKLTTFHALMMPFVKANHPSGKRWEFTADDASGSLQRVSGNLHKAVEAAQAAMNRERAKQK